MNDGAENLNRQDRTDIVEKFQTSVFGRLERHDIELHSLTGRVSNVEEGVKQLQNTVVTGFQDIKVALTEQRAQKGPGWKEIAGGVILAGTVLGVITTVITMIVNSSIGPQLASTSQQIETLTKKLDADSADSRTELMSFRKERKEHVDDTLKLLDKKLDNLRDKIDWAPKTVETE